MELQTSYSNHATFEYVVCNDQYTPWLCAIPFIHHHRALQILVYDLISINLSISFLDTCLWNWCGFYRGIAWISRPLPHSNNWILSGFNPFTYYHRFFSKTNYDEKIMFWIFLELFIYKCFIIVNIEQNDFQKGPVIQF